MAGGLDLLLPEEVAPADAARVLSTINAATDAATLAETIGFSEGRETGGRIAAALLARRAEAGPFATLDAVLAVTGVNLARFTEIVVALSGARPGRSGGGLLLTPAAPAPWLGQGVAVMGQLLDAAGRGVPGAPVTCIASAGVLTARVGTEVQRGSSVLLTTEPGGILRFAWEPELHPPLDPDAAAALRAELALFDPGAETAGAARQGLAGLAAAYRSPGAAALRQAVDTLASAMPAEPASAHAAWPLMPVTIIALAGPEGRAETVAVTVLRVRNWLGGFLDALQAAIEGDARMADALGTFEIDRESGQDLARGIAGVAEGYAALERGALAERIRDRVAGASVERYVGTVSEKVEPDALVDVVRASGASSAAISGGGFAVFEAIRTVQEAGDTIGGKGRLDGRLGLLEGRFGVLEANAVDRTAFASLSATVTANGARATTLEGRMGRLEAADTPSRADLAALETRLDERFRSDLSSAVGDLRTDLSADIGRVRTDLTATQADLGRVRTDLGTVQRDVGTMRTDLGAVQRDLGTVRTDLGAVQRDLGTVRTDLGAAQRDLGSVRTDLVAVQRDLGVVQRDVGTVRTDLGAVQRDLGVVQRDVGSVRTDLGAVQRDLGVVQREVGTVRTDLGTQIGTLRAENAALGTRITSVDARIATPSSGGVSPVIGSGTIRPRGPGG